MSKFVGWVEERNPTLDIGFVGFRYGLTQPTVQNKELTIYE